MSTAYKAKVEQAQGHVLNALRKHIEADKLALALVAANFPAAIVGAPEAGGPPTFKALPAADRELLASALSAAAAALVAEATQARTQVMAYKLVADLEQPTVAVLVDAVLWLCFQQPALVDAILPSQLLEQVVETVTNEECEGVFAYLDSRIAEFKREPVFQRSYLTLLRTCNLLLKRLSKTANALLCGRILLFLAKFLSLGERSGVNLQGAFNTDNTTAVEDVQEGALDSEGKPVDVALYKTFWGLQAWFSDPPSALVPGKWLEVSRGIRRVLEKFKSEQVAITEAAPGSGSSAAGDGSSVKYLTSSRLMSLQLRDATFRRHFLLQCLILMQYLERPRQKEKDSRERPGLRGKVLEDMLELRRQVYAALEATPEKGREFAAAARHIMQWEDAWTAWKQAGCPREPLEKPPASPPPGAEAPGAGLPPPKRRRLSADAVLGVRVGTDELDRLWNLTEDNLSCLSAEDRGGFKTLHQLMYPVIEQMCEGAEDTMKASKSKVYSWKTLRMVARQNLSAFSKAVQAGGDLEVAARVLYPEECPPAPAPAPEAAPSAAATGKRSSAGGGEAPSPGASGAGTADAHAAAAGGAEHSAGQAAANGAVKDPAAGAAAAGHVPAGAEDEDAVAAEAAAPAADPDAAGEAEEGSHGEEGAAFEDGAAEEGELHANGEAQQQPQGAGAGAGEQPGEAGEVEEGEQQEKQQQQPAGRAPSEAEEGEAVAEAMDMEAPAA